MDFAQLPAFGQGAPEVAVDDGDRDFLTAFAQDAGQGPDLIKRGVDCGGGFGLGGLGCVERVAGLFEFAREMIEIVLGRDAKGAKFGAVEVVLHGGKSGGGRVVRAGRGGDPFRDDGPAELREKTERGGWHGFGCLAVDVGVRVVHLAFDSNPKASVNGGD